MTDISKKKRPIRAFLLFIAAMALVTYFSRALYLNALPHVEVGFLTGGRLYTELEPMDYVIESDQMERIGLPVDLSATPLSVAVVHVGRCDSIHTGEPLISFDPIHGALVLRQASQAVQEAQAALDAWDEDWEAELTEAEKKLNEDIAGLSAAEDIDSTAAELRIRRKELQARRESDPQKNPVRLPLVYALDEAKQREEALLSLADNNWVVCATKDCFVADIMVHPGDLYGGVLPLCQVIPSGAGLRVGFVVSDAPDEEDTASVSLQTKGKDLPGWTFESWSIEGTNAVLWFSADPGDAFVTLNRVSILFVSNRYQYLIPNSSIEGGVVFVLRSRDSAFGGKEDYAVAANLGNAPTDGKNTAVLNGLNGTEPVILRWDRSFGDGDAVTVDNQ